MLSSGDAGILPILNLTYWFLPFLSKQICHKLFNLLDFKNTALAFVMCFLIK